VADIPTLEADPCGRAASLRLLRDKMITGGGVAEFETQTGNGVSRRVKYGPADLSRMDAEISIAEDKCRLKSGKRPRRFAVGPIGRGW